MFVVEAFEICARVQDEIDGRTKAQSDAALAGLAQALRR